MNREPMKHLSFKLGDLPIMKNNGEPTARRCRGNLWRKND